MTSIPKMKRFTEKKNVTISIDKSVEEIYRVGRQNGWDVSEIARDTLTEVFKKLEPQLKRPAS